MEMLLIQLLPSEQPSTRQLIKRGVLPPSYQVFVPTAVKLEGYLETADIKKKSQTEKEVLSNDSPPNRPHLPAVFL